MKKNKSMNMSFEQRRVHLSNPMHLDACLQGSRVFRNKKKYTRKGKSRYDFRKEWKRFLNCSV